MKSSDVDLLKGSLSASGAPSPDRTIQIQGKLRTLEAEFRQRTGRAYTDEQPDKVSKRYKELWEDIRQLRSLLSTFRLIPEEIWRRIFYCVVFDNEGQYDPDDSNDVVKICLVSRRWRDIAIQQPELWRIPSWIYILSEMGAKRIARYNKYLKLLLHRSGSLPISFTFFYSTYSQGESNAGFLTNGLSTFSVLTSESHRWDEVTIHAPIEILGAFSTPQDFPLLSKLSLQLGNIQFERRREEPNFHIDLFARAPMLRHVSLHTSYIIFGWSQPELRARPFVFDLPWSQLETFRETANNVGLYKTLVGAEAPNLTTLRSTIYHLDELPSVPFISDKLQVLRLQIGVDGNVICQYLDLLTLPALEGLEIRGRVDRTSPLYSGVLGIIRRSGCSLRCLALDVGDGDVDAFQRVLTLSPLLTDLDIESPSEAILLSLVLDVDSPDPVLPKLKFLTLYVSCQDGTLLAIDIAAFRLVVGSRMEALREQNAENPEFQQLKAVRFVVDDRIGEDAGSIQRIHKAFDVETVDDDFESKAVKWQTQLKRNFVTYASQADHYNLKLHFRMNKTMRGLEKIDLSKLDVRALTRIGIPSALQGIGAIRYGSIPGNRIFRFQKRAEALCKSWKPVLVEGIKRFPYRWVYQEDHICYLQYNSEADDDEDPWKDIIGGDDHHPVEGWFTSALSTRPWVDLIF